MSSSDGRVALLLASDRRDIAAGFTIPCETLGTGYGAAVDRADILNRMLDDWRAGRENAPDEGPTRFGSLAWMFAAFEQTASFEELSERTKPELSESDGAADRDGDEGGQARRDVTCSNP